MAFGYAIAKADDIVSTHHNYYICSYCLDIVQDEDQIQSDLQNALNSYYSSNDTSGEYDEDLNDVVDFIQEALECCGINSTEDWDETPFYRETNRLPSSCCGRSEPENCTRDEAYDQVSTHKLYCALKR